MCTGRVYRPRVLSHDHRAADHEIPVLLVCGCRVSRVSLGLIWSRSRFEERLKVLYTITSDTVGLAIGPMSETTNDVDEALNRARQMCS